MSLSDLDKPLLEFIRIQAGYKTSSAFYNALDLSRQAYNYRLYSSRGSSLSDLFDVWAVVKNKGLSPKQFADIIAKWLSYNLEFRESLFKFN